MFLLQNPSDAFLRDLDAAQRDTTFTQPAVGATRDWHMQAPRGFVLDRYGTPLGEGAAAFERAKDAIASFRMYPAPWTRVFVPGRSPDDVGRPAVTEGMSFVSVVRHLGFYSALPCRVVFVEDGPDPKDARVQCFGFALGTLPAHAECGEERFSVRWDTRTNRVAYEVLAYSRPQNPLARLGYPITRALQRRFARDSRAQMASDVGAPLA